MNKIKINERKNYIPIEAVRRSIEVRNQIPSVKPTEKDWDSFGEDRMSRNAPSNDTVLTAKPDDTVQPG